MVSHQFIAVHLPRSNVTYRLKGTKGDHYMNINNILRNHLSRTERVQPSFRSLQPNQVIQGTIVKLFPNNQALIQIGQEQRIAQLDTALAVGEKYYFQVVNNEQYMHLKVLGDPLEQEVALNVQALLQQLGLSSDRPLRQFVQHLIQEQIPFDRNTLIQSLPLLSLNDHKQTAFRVIQHMIVRNLPLTENVFQAQQALMTENFTNLLQQIDDQSIQTALKDSSRGQQLLALIQDYKQSIPDQQFARHLLQSIQENPLVRDVFQGLNVIKSNLSINNRSLFSLLSQRESIFNVELPVLKVMMQRMVSEQGQITSRIKDFLATWEQELSVHIQEQRPMSAQRLSLMSEQLRPILQTFLSNEQIVTFNHVLQQHEQLPLLLNMLVALGDEHAYEILQQTMTNDFAPKAEFLQQIHHTLAHLGLNYEQLIRDGQVNEQPLTLKQTLLQMVQQQLPMDQERIQQLLHFINGLQLQSVEETNHFIYGNFVLPGDKLQLNSDLYMQFQSKKTKDDTIDPNHCRILFFLHLEALDHTIVDMAVQDRIISLTVFNNQQFLKSLVKPLEHSLKRQLSEIDYQLSSITYKPLAKDDKQISPKTPRQFMRKNYSGVDFRI